MREIKKELVLFYFRTEAYLRFLSKIVQAERRTKQIHLFFIPRRSNLSSLNSPNPPIHRPVRHQLRGHRHRRAHLQTGSLPLRTAEKHQHLRCKEQSLFRLATARTPKQSLSRRCRRTGPSNARVEGGIAFNSFCYFVMNHSKKVCFLFPHPTHYYYFCTKYFEKVYRLYTKSKNLNSVNR